MAKFQVSDSANHENPGFNIDGEHQRFHEAVIALQTELADKAAPALVTRAQVDGAINAFSDLKMSFFRLRKFEHTTERLCGAMRALYGGGQLQDR